MKLSSVPSRILSALIYADLFQYPLTIRELLWWVPSDEPVSPMTLARVCHILQHTHRIGYTAPFFYLSKNKKYIHERTVRMKQAETKMQRSIIAARRIRFLPTVMCIAVTGSVAVGNAKKEDDIDLLIIVKKHTMWTTRFFVTLFIELTGMRRHPHTHEATDKICLNMFMTDDALGIPKEERGWYSAHELLQCVPLWERDHTYRKLLRANRWVRRYFFTAWQEKQKMSVHSDQRTTSEMKWISGIEPFFRWIQLRYMAKTRTTERVSDTYIRFHPKDVRGWIQNAFATALRKRQVPLDKRFF